MLDSSDTPVQATAHLQSSSCHWRS